VLLGTAAYLSPEQVERGIADPRSDVYSAGLLLYEMLTGVKAFPGDSPIQVAYQHVHGEVPVPSVRVASVPGELDALVALATSRDPDDRPTDAGDLLTQVRRSRHTLSTDELDHRPSAAESGRGGNPTMPLGRTTTRAVPRAAASSTSSTSAPTKVRERRRRWPALLASVLVLVLLAGAGTWWFTLGPGARVEVPPLAGLSQQDAVDTLTQQHLDPVTHPQYSEHVGRGLVISAEPSAGASLPRGSDVRLAVSRGPERHDVPRLVGSTRSEAKALLVKHHLRVGKVDGTYDENIAKGAVVATSPEQGKPLKRGAKVSLTLSKGPQPIPVADVVGQSKQDATSRLEDAGLTVDASHEDYSTKYDQGTVMAQSPANGTLHRGDTVELTVSKGPEMVEVPDVNGKQAGEAEQILTRAGFEVSYRKVLGGVFQTVRLQQPEAGSMAPKGSTVTLTIV
jgi:serine/threonine-protein kinase